MEILIISLVLLLIGDRGNLVSDEHKPKISAAYFTGPGLDSINNELCNVSIDSLDVFLLL